MPSIAHAVTRAFISVNRLARRRSGFRVGAWVLDSGAFTEITRHGGHRMTARQYADQIARWARVGQLEAAVAQDWMCEPQALARTGLSVADHQRLTCERYADLMAFRPATYIMPVLQGWHPEQYAEHIEMYGDSLERGAWVGVGSVCKRQNANAAIVRVVSAIRTARPDLRLHGFGLNIGSLKNPDVCQSFETADSMAWSFAARKAGRNQNCFNEAAMFERDVSKVLSDGHRQLELFGAA